MDSKAKASDLVTYDRAEPGVDRGYSSFCQGKYGGKCLPRHLDPLYILDQGPTPSSTDRVDFNRDPDMSMVLGEGQDVHLIRFSVVVVFTNSLLLVLFGCRAGKVRVLNFILGVAQLYPF